MRMLAANFTRQPWDLVFCMHLAANVCSRCAVPARFFLSMRAGRLRLFSRRCSLSFRDTGITRNS